MTTNNNDKRSISAVTAFILAIIALLLSAVPIVNNFAFLLAILAIIFGVIGYKKTSNGRSRGRKTSIISLVLAVLACVIVLASQSFYGNTLDNASKEAQESIERSSGEKTGEILGNELDVTFGKFQATEKDFITETKLPVKVTNKTSKSQSYSVQVEAVDKSGSRIAEDTINIENLSANQSQNFQVFLFVETEKIPALKDAKFKVASISQY